MITVNYFNRTNTVTIFNKFVGRNAAEKNIQLYADFGVALTEANTVKPITPKSALYRTVKSNFKPMCVRTLRENEYIVGYCVSMADKDPAVICVIGNTEILEYFSMLIYHKRGNRYTTQHRECSEVKQSKKSKFGHCDIFYIFNFYAPIVSPREPLPAAPAAVKPEPVEEQQPEPVEQPVEPEIKPVTAERAEQLHAEERTEASDNQREKEFAKIEADHNKYNKVAEMVSGTNDFIEHQAQVARLQEQARIIAEQPHVYDENFKMKVVPPVYRLLGLKSFPKSRKVYIKHVDGIDYKYSVVKLTDDAAATLHDMNVEDLKPEHKVLHMRPVIVAISATEPHQDFILVHPYENYGYSFTPCNEDMEKIYNQREEQEKKENQLQTQNQLLQNAIAQKKLNDSRGSLLFDGSEPGLNISEVAATQPANDWNLTDNETGISSVGDVNDLIAVYREQGDEDTATAIEMMTDDLIADHEKLLRSRNAMYGKHSYQ